METIKVKKEYNNKFLPPIITIHYIFQYGGITLAQGRSIVEKTTEEKEDDKAKQVFKNSYSIIKYMERNGIELTRENYDKAIMGKVDHRLGNEDYTVVFYTE